MITVAVCSDRASALVGRIVFVSDRDGKEELYVINPDGSGLRRLTYNGDAGDAIVYPIWSPDGAKLAFMRVQIGPGGRTWIHVLDLDTGIEHQVYDKLSGGYQLTGFWWSHGGRCLAWELSLSHGSPISYLYGTPVDTTSSRHYPCFEPEDVILIDWEHDVQPELITTRVVLSEKMNDIISNNGLRLTLAHGWHSSTLASRSPNSRWITFSARGLDGNVDIYVLDTATKKIHRLTTDPANDMEPDWSPVSHN